jgi:hypothetical protein
VHYYPSSKFDTGTGTLTVVFSCFLERFGPSPHRVQIGIVLPSDKTESVKYFTVEMAPLESMPHAVHLFLEQVSHGLWDNAWFYLNGPHVIQAGPTANDDEEWDVGDHIEGDRDIALKPFRERQLDQLAFPEYSEDFPHVQWTLGFTGRPGGPDWYINKVDNTESHGPGGQGHHDIEEFADPCFAKVVDGFDTLQAAFQEATYGDDYDPEYLYYLEEAIHIVGAKLMEMPPPIVETEHTLVDHNAVYHNDHDDSKRKMHRTMMKPPKIAHQVEP